MLLFQVVVIGATESGQAGNGCLNVDLRGEKYTTTGFATNAWRSIFLEAKIKIGWLSRTSGWGQSCSAIRPTIPMWLT